VRALPRQEVVMQEVEGRVGKLSVAAGTAVAGVA
jgi:hypothetical protein